MRIPTPDEFFQMQKKETKTIDLKYAKIISFNEQNKPMLKFAGETAVSEMVYPRVKGTSLAIGDLVQLIDGVIQGAIE